jgi:ribosomal protein S21
MKEQTYIMGAETYNSQIEPYLFDNAIKNFKRSQEGVTHFLKEGEVRIEVDEKEHIHVKLDEKKHSKDLVGTLKLLTI